MNHCKFSARSVASLLALLLCFSVAAQEEKSGDAEPFLAKPVSPKTSIRFYKANRALQADRISLVGGDTAAAGCQNLIKKARVFKLNV